MTLKQHVAVTGAAATLLVPFCTITQIALFAVGSILIDVDHYFLYIRRRRCFNIRGMFRYYEELWKIEHTLPYVGLCLFHTIDFFLLVALLSLRYPVLLPLFAGLIFHFFVDLYDLMRKKIPFIRAYLLVEHMIRRRAPGYPYY